MTPLPELAVASLQHRFPVWVDVSQARVAGIVVLGGGNDRLIEAARLARRFPAAKVIYSTGGGSEARAAVLSQLANLGIPAERAAVNTLSHNTADDAAAAVVLAQPQPQERWVLVTSAAHMPRAMASFRAVGFTVEPDPVIKAPSGGASRRWLEMSTGPEQLHMALKEYVGLLAYFMLGRSFELFPSAAVDKGSNAAASAIGPAGR